LFERVKGPRQRNLTRRRARHGPDKIQHQDDKKIWLVEIGVFPIAERKDERSFQRLVSREEVKRVVSPQDAGELQASLPGIVERSR
jgi:hypothetical protein